MKVKGSGADDGEEIDNLGKMEYQMEWLGCILIFDVKMTTINTREADAEGQKHLLKWWKII